MDLPDDAERSDGLFRAERSIVRLRHTHDGGLKEQDRRTDFVFDRWVEDNFGH